MSRTDWTAVQTESAAEYTARIELERLDLRPYLPQIRKRWTPPRSHTLMTRRYPLFPGYILLSIRDADKPAVRFARGLRRLRPILSDGEGRLWRCPEDVITGVREAEERGEFDEVIHQGDPIRLASGVLAGVAAVLVRNGSGCRAEVLLPLFGGVKATLPQAHVAHV